ncbi:hypothetical protein [Salipiger sp.]|uniref:hypothetical protein n=1 Tax=Salipiger sp. TaxID=2078585 RepID=UPI003A977204
MILRALIVAFLSVSGFAAWQYARAERLADRAARLETCREVQTLKEDARRETDDDLADRITRP